MKNALVPSWFFFAIVIALACNLVAGVTTNWTIGVMGAFTDFAREVRENDLRILWYYRFVAYPLCTAIAIVYLWPLVAWFRCGRPRPVPPLVQRRAIAAPLGVAAIAFAPWLVGMVVFPTATLIHFGRWAPELSSQHVWSPLVNSSFSAATTWLLLDWLFRERVVPEVFPEGELVSLRGATVVGVGQRLFVTLFTVAFLPLFTMLGLVRSAAVRFEAGLSVREVVPALGAASTVTFAVYVVLGVGLTLVLARSLTGRLREVAAAMERVRRGDLDVRLDVESRDEMGVVEDGLNSMVAALRDRERILHTFGRVVEPTVRDRLLAGNVRLGGELRTATVLFCDLRGFTAMSEQVPPGEVVVTLNEFFTALTTWVRGCGGFVDKFIGDSLLVVFGLFDESPDDAGGAAAALRCALGVREQLAGLNREREQCGRTPLAVTMGVHSGELLAGTIGADDRHEYTVVGDTVNVAARLQAACKERNCELLVSETTFRLAATAGFAPELDALDALAVRGRNKPVPVFGRPR